MHRQSSLTFEGDSFDEDDDDDLKDEEAEIKRQSIDVIAGVYIRGRTHNLSYMEEKPNIVSILTEEETIPIYNTNNNNTSHAKDVMSEPVFILQGLESNVFKN